jgi:hypothetical protein
MTLKTFRRRRQVPARRSLKPLSPPPAVAALTRALAMTTEPALRANLLRVIANLEARGQR